MKINEMCAAAHSNAVSKGWWDDCPAPQEVPVELVNEKLILVVSEISEALEEYRNGRGITEVYVKDGKPEGVPIELADAVIRIGDLCGRLEIDLEEAACACLDGRTRVESLSSLGEASREFFFLDKHFPSSLWAIIGEMGVSQLLPPAIILGRTVIVIGAVCFDHDIDLESAIETKMAYNATRPHRHGGKVC